MARIISIRLDLINKQQIFELREIKKKGSLYTEGQRLASKEITDRIRQSNTSGKEKPTMLLKSDNLLWVAARVGILAHKTKPVNKVISLRSLDVTHSKRLRHVAISDYEFKPTERLLATKILKCFQGVTRNERTFVLESLVEVELVKTVGIPTIEH